MRYGGVVLAVLVALGGAGLILATTGRPYIVVSASMEPAFNVGDMFWLQPVEGAIAPGTVITFRMGGAIITHRVISADGETLTTQGDNNWAADPWPVPRSSVIGAPAFRLPFAGWLVNFARRYGGSVLLVLFLPGILNGSEILRTGLGLPGPGAKMEAARRSAILLGSGEGMAAWRATVQAPAGRHWKSRGRGRALREAPSLP